MSTTGRPGAGAAVSIASGPYTIEIEQTGPASAQLTLTRDGASPETYALSDVTREGNVVACATPVAFETAKVTLTLVAAPPGVEARVSHLWFGDSDTTYPVGASDVAAVLAFLDRAAFPESGA
jgi:hypothetical protein